LFWPRRPPSTLTIALRTQVYKITFKKKTATGVLARRGNQFFKIKAR
jgi:hypothetical protein